ncbi:adaptin ear-binding coat-associated protein 1 NECAP-1 [Gloeopeniophorella convolvens]|nr:adaptin ear-binding coat-associated protein 1 NECAP-1 [Gloeopeniophorella convolvens]
MEDFATEEIESILYIAREICVYRIPPLKANEGHRAQEWGDLAQPLWKGRMRIIEKSEVVSLLFEDVQTGESFAKATYDPAKPSVEAVLDSSRYFVVRVEDNGRKAYIGMGFAERSDSFDFNVALQDYTKRWRARMNPPSPTSAEPSPHVPTGPKKDYTLKEGQTFTISIPGRAGKTDNSPSLLGSGNTTSASSGTSAGTGGGAFPLLPPPPSAPKRR